MAKHILLTPEPPPMPWPVKRALHHRTGVASQILLHIPSIPPHKNRWQTRSVRHYIYMYIQIQTHPGPLRPQTCVISSTLQPSIIQSRCTTQTKTPPTNVLTTATSIASTNNAFPPFIETAPMLPVAAKGRESELARVQARNEISVLPLALAPTPLPVVLGVREISAAGLQGVKGAEAMGRAVAERVSARSNKKTG
ncbi:hypothetical protein C8R44DRAFT_749923 [Mycena epipterygia]|nr:hypothetical protein C8R44DRAFT_749923 [Mycena epipterygia]